VPWAVTCYVLSPSDTDTSSTDYLPLWNADSCLEAVYIRFLSAQPPNQLILSYFMADRESILAAIENRKKSGLPSSPTPASASDSSPSTFARPVPKMPNYSDFDKDHDRRQEFRRLVDPGITRPNSREVAYEAIKVRPCLLVLVITPCGEG